MRIDTTRFGKLTIEEDQLLLFPQGLIGMETLRQWTLLPDPANELVAWLQSASCGDRALAVVSPRLFVPDYKVRVGQRELAPLNLRPGDETYILSTLSGHVGNLAMNLRAPIIVNLTRRNGCQVVTTDDQPLRQALPMRRSTLRMAA
ncbi:flagellar assembly protein FliW [Roseimaritima ulvae]|uniref:Flagellar assembly factor FliW n=1 Tax=Roseimaritima ulvae TaxID=980254 RepID=A0A5B9QMQ8_9BACT|nr:flagellar assembly protein FliW [Roseimaritima ulvae]QEG39152.1 Flagellar assembly factor FliW [Roseimaritima ulvae]